jgi:hypothetical protein
MNQDQLAAVMQALVLSLIKVTERLKAAEDTIQANGLTVQVAAPNVEPQINVEGTEIDLSGLVDAVNGLTTDNVAESVSALLGPITAIAQREGVDLTGLIDAQGEIAGTLAGSTIKLLGMQERSLEAQAKTGDEISRLANQMEKTNGAMQLHISAIMEALKEVKESQVEQIRVLASPKQLTFGSDGKPVGVETVMRQ